MSTHLPNTQGAVHPDQRGHGIRLSDAHTIAVRDCRATKVQGDGVRLGAEVYPRGMASVAYGDIITLHDDGQITFAEGVTAEDRGDEIELSGPGAGRTVFGPEGLVIFGGGRHPERNLAAVPFIRQALAAAGVPTTRF